MKFLRAFVVLILPLASANALAASTCMIATTSAQISSRDGSWLVSYSLTRSNANSSYVTSDLEQARRVAEDSKRLGLCDAIEEIPFEKVCYFSVEPLRQSSTDTLSAEMALVIRDISSYKTPAQWPANLSLFAENLRAAGTLGEVKKLNICGEFQFASHSCYMSPKTITGIVDGEIVGTYEVEYTKWSSLFFPDRQQAEAFLNDPFCTTHESLTLVPNEASIWFNFTPVPHFQLALEFRGASGKTKTTYKSFSNLAHAKEMLNDLGRAGLVDPGSFIDPNSKCKLSLEGSSVIVTAGGHQILSLWYHSATDLTAFMVLRDLLANGFCSAVEHPVYYFTPTKFQDTMTANVELHYNGQYSQHMTVALSDLLALKSAGVFAGNPRPACAIKVVYQGSSIIVRLNSQVVFETKDMAAVVKVVGFLKEFNDPTVCSVE